MNNRGRILSIVLAIALVVTGVWGYNQYRLKNTYKVALNNDYQRLFYDMKDHIENVQVSLSKALLSESKDQNILLLNQVMQQAYLAQEKLSQLPVNHGDISKTEKFLNQVADYSYSLMKGHLNGKPLTDEQREAMTRLQNYTGTFNKELAELHDKISEGKFNFDIIGSGGKRGLKEANEDMLNTRLANLEEQFTETPELIYDGPFSEQVMSIKPRGLGKGKVNAEKAEDIAREFLGVKKVRKFTLFDEGKQSDVASIESYTFSVAPENEKKEQGMYIAISKIGGNVVWMANPRTVNKINLSVKQAETYAKKFLEEKGYKNMESNYSLRYDGVALLNFAYKENDVTIYPDLIKVKVALDNGEIVGYDAAAYLTSHYDRDIPEPKLTEEEARDRVRYSFDIDSIRLAIIPKEGKKEALCYEFKGKYQGSDFIVYINALTGQEEDILKIIKDENGTLTF